MITCEKCDGVVIQDNGYCWRCDLREIHRENLKQMEEDLIESRFEILDL